MKWVGIGEAPRRVFPVFISALTPSTGYVGSILFWTTTGSWAEGDDVWMSFEVEHLWGPSQEDVLRQAQDWLEKKFQTAFHLRQA